MTTLYIFKRSVGYPTKDETSAATKPNAIAMIVRYDDFFTIHSLFYTSLFSQTTFNHHAVSPNNYCFLLIFNVALINNVYLLLIQILIDLNNFVIYYFVMLICCYDK